MVDRLDRLENRPGDTDGCEARLGDGEALGVRLIGEENGDGLREETKRLLGAAPDSDGDRLEEVAAMELGEGMGGWTDDETNRELAAALGEGDADGCKAWLGDGLAEADGADDFTLDDVLVAG
jgi:hypothetical protein